MSTSFWSWFFVSFYMVTITLATGHLTGVQRRHVICRYKKEAVPKVDTPAESIKRVYLEKTEARYIETTLGDPFHLSYIIIIKLKINCTFSCSPFQVVCVVKLRHCAPNINFKQILRTFHMPTCKPVLLSMI